MNYGVLFGYGFVRQADMAGNMATNTNGSRIESKFVNDTVTLSYNQTQFVPSTSSTYQFYIIIPNLNGFVNE
jgi:hypothetical protein